MVDLDSIDSQALYRTITNIEFTDLESIQNAYETIEIYAQNHDLEDNEALIAILE